MTSVFRQRWRQIIATWRHHPTREEAPPMVDDPTPLDPPEPPDGQESEPPDLLLATIAAVRLLRDIRGRLEKDDDDDARDLVLRIGAVVAVLARVRRRLEEGTP